MNTFQISLLLAWRALISPAAEQLHVTQPAVTQQIHSLEKELGVSLFARTTRSVRLTQEGRLFSRTPGSCSTWPTGPKRGFRTPLPGGSKTWRWGVTVTPASFPCLGSWASCGRAIPISTPICKWSPFPRPFVCWRRGPEVVVGFRKPGW